MIFASADNVTRTRLLTHSGHGGVTSLTSDISCVHTASAETAVRVTFRRISGSNFQGLCADGGRAGLFGLLCVACTQTMWRHWSVTLLVVLWAR